ncbi:hypothetical protein [Plasticicumulans sp.]|uniref:hypothetical protein n=1 Tax=Plasticicumulans sp. TaxID=2307179 RepID=UPI0032209958
MARTPGSHSRSRPVTDSRQRIWNAIRIYKRFTAFQILSGAGLNKSNVQKYLRALERAGYIAIARKKASGKTLGHAVYRLCRDTGPAHPLPRRDGSGVWDQNQQRLYPYAVTQDAVVSTEPAPDRSHELA